MEWYWCLSYFAYFCLWSYLQSTYLFCNQTRPHEVASGCVFILTSDYIFSMCTSLRLPDGFDQSRTFIFLYFLSFMSSILHLPALVGKDCASALGTDDEDERTHQKAPPDEWSVYWKEEAWFSVEHAPEPAGMLLSFRPPVARGSSVAVVFMGISVLAFQQTLILLVDCFSPQPGPWEHRCDTGPITGSLRN